MSHVSEVLPKGACRMSLKLLPKRMPLSCAEAHAAELLPKRKHVAELLPKRMPLSCCRSVRMSLRLLMSRAANFADVEAEGCPTGSNR